MNKQQISISILLVGIMAMMFPANHAVSGQPIFLTNEQQQSFQNQQQLDPSFMSFEQFMQYMFYYEKMFGKDYVTKIYKEYHNDDDDDDDDDDNDRNKKHHNKDWWKHNSKDKDWWKEHNDKKKYCEGKGEWNNGKCHYNSEEDKTAHEDAVCDDGKKSKFCGNANNNNKDDDDDDSDGISERELTETMKILENEEENQKEDYDEQLEEEQEESKQDEEEEDEPEEEEDSDSDDSDDSGGDSDDGDSGDSEEG